MLAIKLIDVGCTEKSPVKEHFGLFMAECIHVGQQFSQCFDIRDVASQFPAIKRQAGFLTEQQAEVDLCQWLMIFIVTISNLPDTFRITGYRRTAIGQIFFSTRRFPWSLKKTLPLPGIVSHMFRPECQVETQPQSRQTEPILTMAVIVARWGKNRPSLSTNYFQHDIMSRKIYFKG